MAAVSARLDQIIINASKADICRLLWSKVSFLPNGCWVRLPLGRPFNPRISFRDGRIGAHRLALYCATKFLPAGLWALHSCGYSKCVRPSHLYWGSPLENSADRIRHYREAGKSEDLCKSLLGQLSVIDIARMWKYYFEDGLCVPSISREMNLSHGYVSSILRRVRKKRVTRLFRGDFAAEQRTRSLSGTLRNQSRWLPHQSMPGLSSEQVVEIRRRLNLSDHPKQVSREMGISLSVVRGIKKNALYRNIPGSVSWTNFESKGGNTGVRKRLCDVAKFDAKAVKIFRLYHEKGLTLSQACKCSGISKAVAPHIISRKYRSNATAHLPQRGESGAFGKQRLSRADVIAIFEDFRRGLSAPSISASRRIPTSIIYNVINRKSHTKFTAHLLDIDRSNRTRLWKGGKKISEADVMRIREAFSQGRSTACLAKDFGLVQRSVHSILSRKTWAWVE